MTKHFRKIWEEKGLPLSFLRHLHVSNDPDPVVNSSFKLGSVAQTAVGLAGLSAAYLHHLRGGSEQEVNVDARHAVLEFKSEAYYILGGQLPEGEAWDNIAGLYATKGGTVRIHTNFPHHRQGILDILGCKKDATRADVSKALLSWDAFDFEEEAARRGMCSTAIRSFAEWDSHPQGLALANAPLVSLTKIGDAPKRQPASHAKYPLQGFRVLDLSRVLAGPTCGRALAAHGADVLLITSLYLPDLPLLDVDTSRGKRTTQLDLTTTSDCQTLQELIKDADVFLQAYRPGSLSAKGFGPESLSRIRPGIVCANLCAWGWEGPWKDRRGFDSLVQTATGFNIAEGEAFDALAHGGDRGKPRPLPVQALDHAAGYLLAFGINTALCKTITEGGSWEVRVSLAGVANWIRSFGRVDNVKAFTKGKPLPERVIPQDPEIAALSVSWRRGDEETGLSAIRHAATLSATPADDGQVHSAPVGLAANDAAWLV